MRLWVFSDLHSEMSDAWQIPSCPEGVDAVVTAGDINSPFSRGVRQLGEAIPSSIPVFYIPGNHEYYSPRYLYSMDEADEMAKLDNRAYPNVHLINMKSHVMNDVRFIGATLWTDYKVEGDQAMSMNIAKNSMNDHRLILTHRESFTIFTPQDALKLHESAVDFIVKELQKPFEGKTVVLTHHCPHPNSIHPKYRGQKLNAAFASDLGWIMEEYAPELWIHGHTHSSMDYMVGKTRVLCNPKGYGPNKFSSEMENAEFNPFLIVDI